MKPKPWPPLIPAALDDAGLSAQEFRVICHVARRGNCFEKARQIALRCKLSENTVWTVLKRLEKWGMIKREKRRGETSVFTLCEVEKWKIQTSEPTPNETPTVAQMERGLTNHKRSGEGSAQTRRRNKGSLKSEKGKGEDDGAALTVEFDRPGEVRETVEIPVIRL